ncbi:MAG: hypothetical protein EP297_00970 [Gammaproteobacteria bacterium]|nr:MAG: hypothetical protein EP297_00970 [Gammaproteobacteria bacterium]
MSESDRPPGKVEVQILHEQNLPGRPMYMDVQVPRRTRCSRVAYHRRSGIRAFRDIRPPWMVEVHALQEHLHASPSLDIAAPVHPCTRGILVVLTIKKPGSARLLVLAFRCD